MSILGISAIPALLVDTRSFFYRANNRPSAETKLTLACVVVSLIAVLVVAPESPQALAWCTTLASLFWLFFIAKFLLRHLLKVASTTTGPLVSINL